MGKLKDDAARLMALAYQFTRYKAVSGVDLVFKYSDGMVDTFAFGGEEGVTHTQTPKKEEGDGKG